MSEVTTPVAPEVQQSMTEAEGAEALLARWGARDSAEQEDESQAQADEQEQSDAQEQETEDNTEDGETDEFDAQSEEIEIDVAGEKFKLPPAIAEQAKRIEAKAKEVEAGATRKFQEAADLRKFAESQIESVKKVQEVAFKQADLLAEHRTVLKRMQQLEQVDFNQLAEQDPVALTKLNAEYVQLQSVKQRLEAAYQQAEHKMQQETQAQTVQRFQHLEQFAQKNVKGWSPEYSNTLMEFSVNQLGADPDALRAVMSEPVIRALDLAYKGWKLSQTDPKSKQVVATKTLKPGAAGQVKSNAVQAVEKTQKSLKKSGSVNDAAALILARSQMKRRK
jgi:hypothetical protein